MPTMEFTKFAVDTASPAVAKRGSDTILRTPEEGSLTDAERVVRRLEKLARVVLSKRTTEIAITRQLSGDSQSGSARLAAHAFKSEEGIASAKAGTFKQVADDWLRDHVDELKLRSAKEVKRHLEVYVYPKWEHKRVFDIRRSDVLALGRQIKHTNGQSYGGGRVRQPSAASCRGMRARATISTHRSIAPMRKKIDTATQRSNAPVTASSTMTKSAPCSRRATQMQPDLWGLDQVPVVDGAAIAHRCRNALGRPATTVSGRSRAEKDTRAKGDRGLPQAAGRWCSTSSRHSRASWPVTRMCSRPPTATDHSMRSCCTRRCSTAECASSCRT